MAELTRLTSRDAVLEAIAEHDRIGRDAFLKRYKFGRARDYYVEHDGQYYDSKPLVAAAYGHQYPTEGALGFNEFSGGMSVVAALRRLGFEVVSHPNKYLVLTENEVYADAEFAKWQDVTGERYHFPNGYRNRIRPGREFVYYKGGRRLIGKGDPEYFGWGRIGSVYADPTTEDETPARRQWLCDIEEFRKFERPVSFRDPGGNLREIKGTSAPSSYWRNGVREITRTAFASILRAGGAAADDIPAESRPIGSADAVVPIEASGPFDLFVPTKQRLTVEGAEPSSRTQVSRRLSRHAKEIGDLAEQIVLNWLRAKCEVAADHQNIVWLAADGQTPGWDIEDRRGIPPHFAYEVKGTIGSRFPAIELTANEWQAAERHRDRYRLVLVTNCTSSAPKIAVVPDPWGLFQSGRLAVTPMSFRVELVDK